MPWTDEQAALLRELGVHWVRGGAAASTGPVDAAAGARPRPPMQPQHGPPLQPPIRTPTPMPMPMPTPVRLTAQPLADAPRVLATAQAEVPAARTPGVDPSQLDWEALRAAVASCEACALSRTRTNTVFGVGSRRAHWLIVGEAPGEQEDLRGEPFVGAAGQLLDRMLGAIALRRGDDAGPDPEDGGADRVYIANTLKCRPPGNRNPLPEEMACCEPFLQRQIALLQPRIILAMGRFAVQSLLRSTEPVGRLRGRVHRYQGVPLVVTYHPAYLLRNPADKAKAWADLCLAASVCGGAAAQPR